ncbi:hypothetical protein NL108_007319 [Boleophthalmus pectinirostris]|nr:hypothetical protein NL108_007319 [Boleophthalmus pectinirostris]
MLTSAYRSPRLLQQHRRSSFLYKVPQHSSVNRMVGHCCIVQVTWSCAHCKRSQLCLGVSGVNCNGCLAFKPKWWSRLRMVCLETLPLTSHKRACSCVAIA